MVSASSSGTDTKTPCVRVVLDLPIRSYFDYLPAASTESTLSAGMRVAVPFGQGTRAKTLIGLVLETRAYSTLPREKLKRITCVLPDTAPVLHATQLRHLQWVSDYYHHPIGQTIFQTLPAAYKKVDYCFTPQPPTAHTSMEDHGKEDHGNNIDNDNRQNTVVLNPEQQQAADTICSNSEKFTAFLLEGVTGSGKTEVYLQVIEHIIKEKQVLVLVPEIALTPQMLARFQHYFNLPICVSHSGLSAKQRLRIREQVYCGEVRIVIGTRSAIWLPFSQPGLYIVDEEHDISYKQQSGLLYSARDVALARARQENVPIILGSATPALETVHNAQQGKYHHLGLQQRASSTQNVSVELIDVRHGAMYGILSRRLLTLIEKHLQAGNQVLLLKNRRGYATHMICQQCQHVLHCPRCDCAYTYHLAKNCLICHRCNRHRPRPTHCPACQHDYIIASGYGTERVVSTLAELFPNNSCLQVNSDTVNTPGKMRQMINRIIKREVQIIVGTQMLAKGHNFPGISLVAVLDADFGLHASDYRGEERLAQLLIQVSGRSGRGDTPGHTVIQTQYPQHPILQNLLQKEHGGYTDTAQLLSTQRKLAQLPPFSYHALVRSRAKHREPLEQFVRSACTWLEENKLAGVEIYGPLTPPIEKHASYHRRHILLHARKRRQLHTMLKLWVEALEKMKKPRTLHYSIDVDPQEML